MVTSWWLHTISHNAGCTGSLGRCLPLALKVNRKPHYLRSIGLSARVSLQHTCNITATPKLKFEKYLHYIHYIPLSKFILMFHYAYPIATGARGRWRCLLLLHSFLYFSGTLKVFRPLFSTSPTTCHRPIAPHSTVPLTHYSPLQKSLFSLLPNSVPFFTQ